MTDAVRSQELSPDPTTPTDVTYEPPRVEAVLTQEVLEREVLYASIVSA